MALKMNVASHGDTYFFEKAFPSTPDVLAAVKAAIDKGAVFTITLYTVLAKAPDGKEFKASLSVGSSTLMKQQAGPQILANKVQILNMLGTLTNYLQGNPASQDLTLEGMGIDASSPFMQSIPKAKPTPQGTYTSSTSPKGTAVPSPDRVKLADAEAIGQPVFGSSSDSVYYLIARNERVKVAARIRSNSVSLRVETKTPTPAELKAIEKVVQWHGNYGSTHMALGSCPAHRVIGSVLFDFGVKFDAKVNDPSELKYES